MKFTYFDSQMMIYEQSLDQTIITGIYMAARLDGRRFTRLTRETVKFAAPFDERFNKYMVSTIMHLMNCGVRVIYGYMESDEISLLFHIDEHSFGRKIRKYNSVLAGEASVFSSCRSIRRQLSTAA